MIEASNLRVYFIMGSMNTNQDPAYVLQQAIDGGITAFQYREKGIGAKTAEDRIRLGIALRNICLKHRIPFFVNDDIELAVRLHADGIHIGQDDEPILEVRKRLPAHMAIGLSVSTVGEAKLAEEQGADYLGVGPMYKTTTKSDAREPVGVARLQKIAKEVSIPIVAIGGIKRGNAEGILRSGAAGISVISAISVAENSLVAARELEVTTRLIEVE